MKFALLIYGDEQAAAQASEAETKQEADAYEAFTTSIVQSGNFVDGDPFHPTTDATTVRVRGGKTETSSGPVERTSQQLLAYYKVEADNAEHAVELASRIPGARYGAIEVRPVVHFD
jgi:hypothetical protein